jgi:hypothetical protein
MVLNILGGFAEGRMVFVSGMACVMCIQTPIHYIWSKTPVIYSLPPLQNAVTMYRLHLQQKYTVSRHELLLTDSMEKCCEL